MESKAHRTGLYVRLCYQPAGGPCAPHPLCLPPAPPPFGHHLYREGLCAYEPSGLQMENNGVLSLREDVLASEMGPFFCFLVLTAWHFTARHVELP